MTLGLSFILVVLVAAAEPEVGGTAPPSWSSTTAAAAHKVDNALTAHWQQRGIQPAAVADDREFVRRLTLDLAGRVPTPGEVESFRKDSPADRCSRRLFELLEGPEFALHFARVVDQWIQQRSPGDDKFLAWLRESVEQRRSWDAIFRGVMIGPWESETDKAAIRFLTKRVKSLDNLTSDTARAFFGVDITCARCHDHPLVNDWKQDHYYGLAAFFNRTGESGKNSGTIIERPDGEVTFQRRGGATQTASMMFLSGQSFVTAPKQNRREQLVQAALDDRRFLSRSAVNRTWAYLLGRGLVHPVDQMHSANAASIPAVLDFLADDFAASGYDLRRLVATIVQCRAYQSSSRTDNATLPAESFAAYRLKPLTPWQFAISLELVCGEPLEDRLASRESRREVYLALEKQAADLVPGIDPIEDAYQASAAEALFVSHHANVQKRLTPAGKNLAARLAASGTVEDRVGTVIHAVLGRPASVDELRLLAPLADGPDGVASLIWAVTMSAEFRFNH